MVDDQVMIVVVTTFPVENADEMWLRMKIAKMMKMEMEMGTVVAVAGDGSHFGCLQSS